MNKEILFIALLFLITLPLVSAQVDNSQSIPTCGKGVVEKGQDFLLTQLCSNCTYINITSISYPNTTKAITQTQMQVEDNEFYYNIDGAYLEDTGRYDVRGFGDPDGDGISVWACYFDVTITGKQFTDAQGLSGLGILAGAIALMFFFMILGFKFTETSKPLSLFFVVISIFLAIYSLQLGLQFSAGILEWEGLSSSQSTVYVSILYLVGGIAVISFILMSIAFVREFGKGRMMKNYGAGFDPVSETYI